MIQFAFNMPLWLMGVYGGAMVLVVLSMLFETSLLPVFVLLLIWGTMQVTYTLECIRMGREGEKSLT